MVGHGTDPSRSTYVELIDVCWLIVDVETGRGRRRRMGSCTTVDDVGVVLRIGGNRCGSGIVDCTFGIGITKGCATGKVGIRKCGKDTRRWYRCSR